MCDCFSPEALEREDYSLSLTLAHNWLIMYALKKALGVIGAIKKATERGKKSMRSFIKLSENEETRRCTLIDLGLTATSDNT